ncbi:MAG: hypothetical protein N3D11_06020 [Candidatus Sumerlaeia bacterium]|nr:hypothetical protein [Candidatus Sumerlaeia bacterium]
MRQFHSVLLLFCIACALAFTPSTGFAAPSFEQSSTPRQVLLGTGSGLVSLVYTPAKFLYAAGSTLTGGLILAYTQGEGKDEAARVVRRGTGGDWWVHPDVFTGHRALRFNGTD